MHSSNKAAETTVMLLAAGEGRRMLPLTNITPKPLLHVGDLSLIEHHLKKLQALGFTNIVINTAYLGDQIRTKIKDGSQFGLKVVYSDESQSGALETAGGISKALPLIKSDPFLVVNADIWTDFNFTKLLEPLSLSARLVLVKNPEHNASGDFCISSDNLIHLKTQTESETFTFSGIGLYKKSNFENLMGRKQALAPILYKLSAHKELEGTLYHGDWTDVGTPERLKQLDSTIKEVQQN